MSKDNQLETTKKPTAFLETKTYSAERTQLFLEPAPKCATFSSEGMMRRQKYKSRRQKRDRKQRQKEKGPKMVQQQPRKAMKKTRKSVHQLKTVSQSRGLECSGSLQSGSSRYPELSFDSPSQSALLVSSNRKLVSVFYSCSCITYHGYTCRNSSKITAQHTNIISLSIVQQQDYVS